ncbi:MAG: tetratricopeptide repeat protein [Flavisolibacter sp.]
MRVYLVVISFLLITLVFAQAENSYISKGNEYYRQGNFAQAEVQYRQAVKTNPQSETAKYNLANALEKQKKYQEAQDIYEALSRSEDDQRRAAAYYNTGVAYSSQKELESSIDAYKNALRIKPDDREARENLQKALSELKQQQQSSSGGSSNMSGGAADEKLKQLEQKEKDLRKRMQSQQQGQSGTAGKDW